MKQDIFLSKEEFAKREFLIKCRQERIIQVRKQSKKMAASFLERVKREAEKQYQDTENRLLSEIRDHYSKELASVRQHYDKCIAEINNQHYIKEIGVGNRRTIPTKNSNTSEKFTKSSLNKCSQYHSKEIESEKKQTSDKFSDNKITSKNSVSTSSTTTTTTTKKKLKNREHVQFSEMLPENIILDSEGKVGNNNIYLKGSQNQQTFNQSPKKKSVIRRKSVIVDNKENCDTASYDTGANATSKVLKKKNCCINIKSRNPQEMKRSNWNNVFDANEGLDNLDEQRNMNEIYNRLVHDRIRILEQKEKILRKRMTPLTLSISSLNSVNKMNRFSEYFCNLRDNNIVIDPVKPDSSTCNKNKDNFVNRKETDDIENDLSRVYLKKKLLLLELSNAETQTEKCNNLTENIEKLDEKSATAEYSSLLDGGTKQKMISSHLQKGINVKKSISEQRCSSPVLKQNICKSKPVTAVKSAAHKTFKKPRHNQCRREHSKKNKNVVVTIMNNKTKLSAANAEDKFSSFTQNCSTTQSSVDSDLPSENCNSQKTVKIIVNVLPDFECKKNKVSPEKSVNKVHHSENNCLTKIQNWRKIFENEEKLTESSYFSPPNITDEKRNYFTENIKKTGKSIEESENQNTESQHDIGYYVRKLLLMSPESIENLDVSSCSTIIMNETQESIPKSKTKVPINIPLYQNSFDETLDTVFHSEYESRNNDAIENNTIGSLLKKNVDLPTTSKKNVSSIPSSSVLELKKPSINDKVLSRKSNDNYYKIHRKFSNSSKSSKEETDEMSEDSEAEQFVLPSTEELLKQGFILERAMNRKSGEDDETIEEEEFIKEMLKVNTQPNQLKETRNENYDNSAPSVVEESSNNVDSVKINEEVKSNLSKSTKQIKNNSREITKKLMDTSLSDLRKEPRLLGWMDATVQRTLEASAINSTSSGDNNDPVRVCSKTFPNFTDKFTEFTTDNDYTSSARISLSPIAVPDIRLNLASIFKDPASA